MTYDGGELFWELVEPLYADPAVQRSTMMGRPCVRRDGRFFASLEHRTGTLLVKLPRERVTRLIADGIGDPFAPAGRVFGEWLAVRAPDRGVWAGLLAEAHDHAGEVFPGFGKAGLALLAGLETDNSKRFFDAGRDVYQRELLEPAKAFVTALGSRLRPQVPGLRAEPRVGAACSASPTTCDSTPADRRTRHTSTSRSGKAAKAPGRTRLCSSGSPLSRFTWAPASCPAPASPSITIGSACGIRARSPNSTGTSPH